MQLTNTQHDLIDRFLEQHQLDFLDFKLEVKDHLACETEQIMANENIGFEEAFLIASKAWETELTPKKLYDKVFPSLVINKIKKRILIEDIAITFFSIILAIIINNNLKVYFINYYILIKFLILIFAATYFVLRRFVLAKKLKTSYSYRFDYLFFPLLTCLIYIFMIKRIYLDTFGFFIVFSILIQFPFSIFYFMKHQQFIKKHFLA